MYAGIQYDKLFTEQLIEIPRSIMTGRGYVGLNIFQKHSTQPTFYETPSDRNATPIHRAPNKQDKTTCNIRASASWNLSGGRSTSLGNMGST